MSEILLSQLVQVELISRELERSSDELGLDGVMLLSNVAGIYLGDQRLEPLMQALNDRGAYVFIHPGFPPQAPPLPHPVWLYEFTFETVRAVTNLIYTGTLERYPQMRLQLAHLGGAVPFLAHRLASLADREPGLAAEAPVGVLSYLRDLYYDTGLANNEPALAATLKIASSDQVVFGTDWPYAALPREGGDPTPALDVLGAQTRAEIEFENAAALVPRLVDALMGSDRPLWRSGRQATSSTYGRRRRRCSVCSARHSRSRRPGRLGIHPPRRQGARADPASPGGQGRIRRRVHRAATSGLYQRMLDALPEGSFATAMR